MLSPALAPDVSTSLKAPSVVAPKLPLKLTVNVSPDTAVVIFEPPAIVSVSVNVLAVVDPLSPQKVANKFWSVD